MVGRRGHVVKHLVGSAVFALCLAVAVPAAAGNLAELDCAVAGLEAGGDMPAQTYAPGNPPPAVAARLGDCSRRYEWNRNEIRAADQYVRGYVARILSGNALQGQDLDLEAIAREVLADDTTMRAAAELRRTPPPFDSLLARLLPLIRDWGERHSGDAHLLEALGAFVAATALVEGARQHFASH